MNASALSMQPGSSPHQRDGALRWAGRGAAIVALYAVITVWFTWPLAASLRTHLPDTWVGCRTDALVSAWIFSHDSRAFLSNPLRVGDANIYHPTRNALFHGESSLGAALLFVPTFALTGNPVLSMNLLFLAATALTLAAMHVLVWRWTSSHLAALVGAWVVATSRWFFWWTPSAPMYAVLFCFPLIMLLAAPTRVVRGRSIWLAPIIAFQCLTTPYTGLGLLMPLGVLALWRVARPATRRGGFQLVIALGLGALLIAPVYAQYGAIRLENPNLVQQSYWARSLSALAVWLPWGLLDRDRPTGVPLAALALVIAGAAYALVRARAGETTALRERWLYAAYWTAAGVFLSFSPTARWGESVVTLPQTLLWGLPLLENIRVPHRLGVSALFGIAALSGLAFAELSRALARRAASTEIAAKATAGALAALAAGLMFADYRLGIPIRLPPGFIRIEPVYPLVGPLPAEYPLQLAPDTSSPLLATLAERQGAVVEVPIGAGAVGSAMMHARSMYRSIFHWRPLLNGYMSYWPHDYPARMKLVRRLPDHAAVEELHRDADLAFVLVHTGEMRSEEKAIWLSEAEAEAGQGDLRLVARDGDDLLFEIVP